MNQTTITEALKIPLKTKILIGIILLALLLFAYLGLSSESSNQSPAQMPLISTQQALLEEVSQAMVTNSLRLSELKLKALPQAQAALQQVQAQVQEEQEVRKMLLQRQADLINGLYTQEAQSNN